MRNKEVALLDELRKDSRASLTAIGNSTGIPLSTVFKLVARLVRCGIVKRFVAIFDWAKVGFPIRLGVFLDGDKKEVRDFIESQESLNSLFRVSGNADFYAELLFRDMVTCFDFVDGLKALDGVGRVRVFFLGFVMQERFLLGGGGV